MEPLGARPVAAVDSSGCARCRDWRETSKSLKRLKRRGPLKRLGRRCGPPRDSGFDEGLEIEKILGARDTEDGIFYLVKWKNKDDLEFAPALLTFMHFPARVLRFYAKRVSWMMSDGQYE